MRLKPVLRHLRATLSAERGTYVGLSVTTYGALAAGLVAGALVPGLRERGVAGAARVVSRLGLSAVPDAYTSGKVVTAATHTFSANLLLAALLTTTVPSLVVPYFGVVATVGRAGLIGVLLAPASPTHVVTHLPHTLATVAELQAYVLAAFGTALLWQRTLAPEAHGLTSARAGYRSGLRDNARLYVPVTAVLAATAAYEAVEVIHLLPRTV